MLLSHMFPCISSDILGTSTQKIEDMKMIIEDLEALKELADELEENHVETEKQMQEEIGKLLMNQWPSAKKKANDSFLLCNSSDYKDLQLREHKKRNESLEESVADYENTILQFRELVLSLQRLINSHF